MIRWLHKKWTNFRFATNTKLCAGIFLLSAGISVAVIYWQERDLKKLYATEINVELALAKEQWVQSSVVYSSMFKLIAEKIIEKKIENDPKALAALLKQFSIKDASPIVPFIDLHWHYSKSPNRVNVNGVTPAIALESNPQSNISEQPGKLYLSSMLNHPNTLLNQDLRFTMKVANKNKNTIGMLSAELDIQSWLNKFQDILITKGYFITVTDHSKKIIFSSNVSLLNISEQNNFLTTNALSLSPYPYLIRAGYNKTVFNKLLANRLYPMLVTIWSSGVIYFLIQMIFDKRLKREINKSFIAQIEMLSKNNTKYLKEIEQCTSEYNAQIEQLNLSSRYQDKLLKTTEIGFKERKRLETLLGDRISATLAEIRESVRVIADEQNGSLNIKISAEKNVEFLADINDKLAYLSMFCVTRANDELLDLQGILDDTIKIFAREIFELELDIKAFISGKQSHCLFDNLLLRQILANLLHQSILSARHRGAIEIKVAFKKINKHDSLVIIIKDNGFGLHKYKEKPTYPTHVLDLNLNSISGIAESFGGSLTTTDDKSEQTITLTIPLVISSNEKFTRYNEKNILPFKKP